MRKELRILILIIVGLTFSHGGFAQEKENSIQQLSFMIGDWKGAGWVLGQDRTRKSFSQSEHIQSKVDNQVLVVDGLGHEIDSSGAITERVIHAAFGVISYNNERGTFTMITFSQRQGRMEPDLNLIADKKLQWSFKEVNGVTIRFTEDFSTPNKWKEVGEVSMDGQNWHQFFEMNLSK